MKYFKAKFVGKSRFEAEWDAAIEAYAKYLAKVLPRLPESAQAFHQHQNRYELHDMCVEPIALPTSRIVNVELTDWRLEFFRVGETLIPAMEEPGIWLYDELHLLPDDQFGLCALIEGDSGIIELRAATNEIRVFSKHLGRHAVPNEPPPPAPTLFLNQKSTQKRRRKR